MGTQEGLFTLLLSSFFFHLVPYSHSGHTKKSWNQVADDSGLQNTEL